MVYCELDRPPLHVMRKVKYRLKIIEAILEMS